MRIAAQSDFFIRHYGAVEGLKRIKELGYTQITYTFQERYNEPFTTEWTDKEIEEKFSAIKQAIDESGLKLLFATIATDIYSDLAPQTFDARKKMCVQIVKAAAFMGCKVLGVRPASLYHSTTDVLQTSKSISLEVFDLMQDTAKQYGVKLAFINNTRVQCFTTGSYSYGCKASELLELAEIYDGGIIVDPVNAYYAHERVCDLLKNVEDKLLGFQLTDTEADINFRNYTIPMMGVIDYFELGRVLKQTNPQSTLVVMHTPIMKRYLKFISADSFVVAFTQLLYEIAQTLLSDKETIPRRNKL